MSGQTTLETCGLTKRYGATVALDHLDLAVDRGEVFGFLGPNGAGKTTTIRLLLGLARPTSGSARILGLDCRRDVRRLHRKLAYVSSDLALWPQLTGGQTLDLLGRLHGGFDIAFRQELLERFDLDPTRRVRSYSKGNRQKVGLVAAFMTRPDVLVFDEPTTGLDPLVEREFRRVVLDAAAQGQTVFLSSHVLAEVDAVCSRVGILRSGRLVDVGALAEMRHLSARTVTATVPLPAPDLSAVPGVVPVSQQGTVLTCRVTGSMAPLLRALGAAGASSVTTSEPSLEQIFLQHYREVDAAERPSDGSPPIATDADRGREQVRT